MRERTIVYKDDSYDVEITVRQATLGGSFERIKLQSRERAQMKARGEEVQNDPLMVWTAFRALPDCLGATVEIKNVDKAKTQLSTELTFDEFLELPEALIVLWQEATYEVNPHWLPRREESGEAEGPSDNSASTENSSPGSKPENQKMSQNGTSTT